MEGLRAQQLVHETIRKYENLLGRRLQNWCVGRGFRHLRQLGVDEVRQFRSSWADGPVYAAKNLERLRAFFSFCVHVTERHYRPGCAPFSANWKSRWPMRGQRTRRSHTKASQLAWMVTVGGHVSGAGM
jgi:hypothetical protein